MMVAAGGVTVQRPELSWNLTRIALLLVALISLCACWVAPPLYAAAALASLLCVSLSLWSPTIGLCLLSFSVPWLSGFALPLAGFPITLTDILVAALGISWLARSGLSHMRAAMVWTPYIVLFLAALAL